jgi:predicted lipoprotein with Yx(FWY)xxD motif
VHRGTWIGLIGGAGVIASMTLGMLASGALGVSAQGATTVQTQNTSIGTVLANSSSKTLYVLDGDSPNGSKCTGACTTPWPPVTLASGNPVAPAGLPGTLAVVTRDDGGRQVTYNGRPLYTFARDAQAGDTVGEGVNAFGGVWHAVKPAAATGAAASTVPSSVPRTGTGGAIGRPGVQQGVFAGLVAAGLLAGVMGLVLVRSTRTTHNRG